MYEALSSHALMVFLVQIGVILGLALLFGRMAAHFGMPAVTGELCVGVILGPSLLGHFATGLHNWLPSAQPAQAHLIDAVGQIGVLLLVGLSGAQLDFGLIRRETRTVLRVGAAGLIVPLALGIGIGFLLPASLIGRGGDRDTFACFLGVAMAVSAIPAIIKTLQDLGLLHRNIGQLTLAASLVDDTVGWLLLAAVTAYATMRAGQRTDHIVVAFASLAGVLLCAVLAGRPLARLILRWLNHSADPAVHAAAIAALILLAAAGTDALGLEPVFGAFTCGVVIATADGFDRAKLGPLRLAVTGILAPVFFAAAGLRMNLGILRYPAVLAAAACILLVAVVSKFAGAYAGAWLSGLTHWEAIALGGGLNARGVIQIVIATVGLSINVLTASSYTIIVLVAIATSMMAAPILRSASEHIDQTDEETLRASFLLLPT
jgi:K+:H+ antiporter